MINLALAVSVGAAGWIAIYGDTYRDGRLTSRGHWALVCVGVGLALGIWKEILTKADADEAQAQTNQLRLSLSEANERLEAARQSLALVNAHLEETKESLKHARAELDRVPKETIASVPRNFGGNRLGSFSGVAWFRFPVHTGSPANHGPLLRLHGGETLNYTVGFRSGRGPGDQAENEPLGFLFVGDWRHPLHDGGEIQVFQDWDSPGRPMTVDVEFPGQRHQWDLVISVLSREEEDIS